MTPLGGIPAVRAARAHRIERVRSNDPDPSADLSALGIESSTETVYRSVLREGTVSVEGAARAFGVDLPKAEAMLDAESPRSALDAHRALAQYGTIDGLGARLYAER